MFYGYQISYNRHDEQFQNVDNRIKYVRYAYNLCHNTTNHSKPVRHTWWMVMNSTFMHSRGEYRLL